MDLSRQIVPACLRTFSLTVDHIKSLCNPWAEHPCGRSLHQPLRNTLKCNPTWPLQGLWRQSSTYFNPSPGTSSACSMSKYSWTVLENSLDCDQTLRECSKALNRLTVIDLDSSGVTSFFIGKCTINLPVSSFPWFLSKWFTTVCSSEDKRGCYKL